MARVKNDWVCRFEVETPQKHKKGFTVYRLTSFVHSRNAPEAVTKLVVWKRYNDFKRLHTKIKEECKSLNIAENVPTLPKALYFRRFEEDVIRDRVSAAKILLNFIGRHKQLFLGETFRSFCEQGYHIEEKTNMGQSAVTKNQNGDVFCEDVQWRWNQETKWLSEHDNCSLQSESSGDGSNSASETTESGGSLQSPIHDNLVSNVANRQHSNNNIPACDFNESSYVNNSSEDSEYLTVELTRENSLEVEDPAGPGLKPLLTPLPDDDSEVVCQAEHPVTSSDVWLTIPTVTERLAAYSVVGISDPVLIVVHRACPNRRLVLKVLRKSSWPITTMRDVREPLPVPHMVRLFDFIETEDAVFLVMEYAYRGHLWDHVRNLQDRRPAANSAPSADLDVDLLVAHAQKLLASVSRTLEQSDAATSDLNRELESVESSLVCRGHKPRSASAFPRPRLERRLSCDDMPGHRPRTAHGSLDRAMHWTRLPEATVREWAASLIAALDTLHKKGIIWRDLYPDNLLVGEDGRLILTFQHQWHGVERRLNRNALRGLFVAPEARSFFPITAAADWWSVGVILYDLLTGVALSEVHPCGLSSHTVLELPDFLSIESKSLLKELLQFDPNERIGSGLTGSEEIRCHPFFSNVDWNSKYEYEKTV